MKKIFSTFVLAAFFAVAAQAQSNDQSKQTEDTPAKVVTAGTATADDAVQPAAKKDCAPGASKSCCKTKGKETASANEKACCSSDKKSSRAHRRAHRAEGAAETPSVN
jgi:hypothetical protein